MESEKVKQEDARNRKQLTQDVEAELESDPEVDSVVPNYLAQPQWTPNDPSLSAQGNTLPVIRAQRGWNITRGGGARIAVIDSGYDTNHPEFAGTKVAASYDFINRRANAEDFMGHGTHVASIASAVTNNGRGIAGGAPNAWLLIAKTQQPGGFTLAGTIEAITWAADRDADAINMSFIFTGNPGPAMQNAIDYAWRKGSLPVAGAGNTGKCQANYPAAYDRVVGVAAVDGYSRRTSFSTCGAYVDLAAPGANVLAAVPDRKYQRLSGTSMSTPYVSALAGLLGAQNPRLTSAEKYRLMRGSARDMGARGRDNYYGYGIINYEAALKAGR